MKRLLYILAAIVISCAAASSIAAPAAAKKDEFARKLHTFNAIVKELQSGYVDTLDANSIMDKTIGALLYQIDPYTEYYPAGDQDEILSLSQGQYAGIGSVIQKRGNKVIISEPQWESPALKAGLRPGDVIIAVDADTVTAATDISAVSRRLRGQAGTEVRVDVCRPYVEDSMLSFNITRADIKVNPLPYYGIRPDGIGYIRLTTFNESSARRVKEAVIDLMRDPALKGIVLDLRGNGGGLVESAVDIVGFFVPKGTEILRMRGRDKSAEKVYKTSRKPIMPDIPLAVLIDGGSASSSEITAGSLQDLDRAVLIGSRSFGKGLVQGTRPLPYDGFLKVTTGKYYIPSGRLIQALDYSHRNPDGSVARVPDSLTNVYRTAAGREVRDGGGLTPDITVDWGKMSRLLFNIARDNWAFDFATRFAAENPSIPAPEEFEITDGIYADFKASIDPKRFKYDKVGEDLIKQLNETLDAEGYMNDSVRSQLDGLSRLLIHDLDSDLDIKRKDIAEYLGEEIASRYYYERGRAAQQLKGDTAMAEARRILLDPAEYRRILKK